MLAGQYADYIVLQLELFKKGHRGGSSWAHLMEEVAPKLSEQEMRDVAAYYASLE
jgi:cytochrome c553